MAINTARTLGYQPATSPVHAPDISRNGHINCHKPPQSRPDFALFKWSYAVTKNHRFTIKPGHDMRHFALKKAIYQTLKDFSLGIGLFITIFSLAAFDAKTPESPPNQNINTITETIIDWTETNTETNIVDKLQPQHNLATFIRESLKPEYTVSSNQAADHQIGATMITANTYQFLWSDALYLTFIAFIFASMFTLTIGLSRYVRRESASPRRTGWRRD